jgi:pyrroloquinoline quinone biosynthesis protein B
VLAILKSNSIFNVLGEKNVARVAIEVDRAFEPALPGGAPSGIEILPFIVAGKSAWYLEGKAHPGGADGAGDTLGLRIRDKATDKHFYFIAACAGVTDELKSRLDGAPLLFFDGTVWRDDELITAGLGAKTGQGMGHISMSGTKGAIESLADVAIDRRVFLHINNSNPALLRGSAERKMAESAGWQIPADGTEIVL